MFESWATGTIVARHDWAPGLATITIEAPLEPFVAGQFVNLGLPDRATESQIARAEEGLVRTVRRSYSIASAPSQPLEVYMTLVEQGALTPRVFDLRCGDQLLVEPTARGFFVLSRVPECREIWLVATGTGLGPYISMLRTSEPWERFERIVVVHGARLASHLSYADELQQLARDRPTKLSYVRVVSRDSEASDALHGRITSALAEGALERQAGVQLDAARSHVMLCGNPDMVREMIELLGRRGLKKHRQKEPGHITFEKYW